MAAAVARDWSTWSGTELLTLAVDRLQAEVPVELSGPVALERLRAVMLSAERLQAVRLAAVRDVDARELYALDGAGSTRGWLRAQLGGDDGQLALARRLSKRPHVEDAHAQARIATRAAALVCAALEAVPTEVEDAQLCAVLRDGLAGLLHQYTGGTARGSDAEPALRAQQDEDEALLERCCQDVLLTPAQRLEPAFVLLAQRLPAGLLAWALRMLVDPLLPDGNDQDEADPYCLELRPLLDGDVDVRGHLDAETGQSLAAELERRLRSHVAADRDGSDQGGPDQATPGGATPSDVTPAEAGPADATPADATPDQLGVPDGWDVALESRERGAGGPAQTAHVASSLRLLSIGRRRVDALKALLRDVADAPAGSGEARPVALTVTATLEAFEGRLGALPGMLTTTRLPAPLRTETLH